ncbi:MAG: hypothetical protein ACM3ZE_22050 [Myxococcales bacterium]
MPTQSPKLPVVSIASRDGCVWLDTFDYELYDYLEDYFVEKCDLDPQSVHLTNESPPRYSLVLPSKVSPGAAVDAIAKLLATEPEPTFACDLTAIR